MAMRSHRFGDAVLTGSRVSCIGASVVILGEVGATSRWLMGVRSSYATGRLRWVS